VGWALGWGGGQPLLQSIPSILEFWNETEESPVRKCREGGLKYALLMACHWPRDLYSRQILLGSLAGAAQSLNGNEIDQSRAQKRQKLFVDVNAKSSIDLDLQ